MKNHEADIARLQRQISQQKLINIALLEGQMAAVSLVLGILTDNKANISKALQDLPATHSEILKLIKGFENG